MNKKDKKIFLELIHDLRFAIIILITILWAVIVGKLFSENHPLVGTVGIFALIVFLKSLFRENFETEHNLALIKYKDTVIERMLGPGDWIFLLPGYKLLQRKGDFLLSTLELSLDIPDEECQFRKGEATFQGKTFNNSGKDSITMEKAKMNYYLNRDAESLYRFVTQAPKDWDESLGTNITGDIAASFQRRINVLEQAQVYKDFIYISNKNQNDGKLIDGHRIPGKIFWQINENDREDFAKSLGFQYEKDKILPVEEITELETTIWRATRYGLRPVNITIGNYKDNKATDEARNAIRRQDFENETKFKKTLNRKERIEVYSDFYKKNGYDQKEALSEAIAQVAREDGDRFDYGGSSNNGPNILVNSKK